MSCIREEIEKRELSTLSPFASCSAKTLGREVFEEPCKLRTEYQRDRDRIIHCKSFRRLKHKTQVFISPRGDHYRTRLTHTLEVTHIARNVSRALGLNEDLTEAIALGHDLGHTPFGHAGESALNDICEGGFKHYNQSVRVLSRLEKDGRGLNLTKEVLNGILCHTKGEKAFTAEGRVVRLCDRVAYINHDMEDAIRAGLLNVKDIPEKFVETFGNRYSKRINTMVTSIVENSKGKDIKMGDDMGPVFDDIHEFMYSRVYLNKQSFSEDSKVPFIIQLLYDHFMNHPQEMPEYLLNIAKEESLNRAVCDYIAGMSDKFATDVFKEIFIPKSVNLKSRF